MDGNGHGMEGKNTVNGARMAIQRDEHQPNDASPENSCPRSLVSRQGKACSTATRANLRAGTLLPMALREVANSQS